MVSGWCPCVPLGRRTSSSQREQQDHVVAQQDPSSASNRQKNRRSVGPFTISAASERHDMVQMFYYENRGKCCRKLLRYNGYSNKVCFILILFWIYEYYFACEDYLYKILKSTSLVLKTTYLKWWKTIKCIRKFMLVKVLLGLFEILQSWSLKLTSSASLLWKIVKKANLNRRINYFFFCNLADFEMRRIFFFLTFLGKCVKLKNN